MNKEVIAVTISYSKAVYIRSYQQLFLTISMDSISISHFQSSNTFVAKALHCIIFNCEGRWKTAYWHHLSPYFNMEKRSVKAKKPTSISQPMEE